MKIFIYKRIAIVILSLILVTCAKAQQTAQKFIQETHYLLYLPEGYASDTTKKWPLLLFLHGSGESGGDLEKVKVNGPPKLIEQGKKFPFIIVSPQAADAAAGFQSEVLKGLLSDLKKKYRVDNDRVYLTGLSMGGFGTWDLAEKHPEEFAAIAPICSGGPLDKIWAMRHIPVWCFHGAKDDAVPLSDSQQMVDSLKKYHGNVRFTIYPDANHNSWEATYNNDSLYRWFLSQKKFKYTRVSLPPNLLKEYTGVYICPEIGMEGDTIRIENNKLMSIIGDYKFECIPSSGTNFFAAVAEDNIIEIIFFKNGNGKISGFWEYDQQNKNLFTKVITGKKQ